MVQPGFTRKKVESLTLGEKLRKLRMDFRMSLTDVSKSTRIQVKYLESLESGSYEALPADVYVRGFLRSYARYLNVDEQALIKLYERERNIQENLGREHAPHEQRYAFTPLSFVITSRSVVIGLIALLVFGAFLYIYREFQSFAEEPQLSILEPENGAVVDGQEVVVRGKTDRSAEVTLNNQGVFVDTDGLFTDKVTVRPGMNTLLVKTVNRFNKEKTATISVESRYVSLASPALEPLTQIDSPESFEIAVSAPSLPVSVRVLADDVLVYSGKLEAKESKSFRAKGVILVESDQGSVTRIRLANGQEEFLTEALGAGAATFSQEGRKE